MGFQLNVKIGVLAILTLFFKVAVAQEYSAGINTESPNQYAVLHLVAPNGDQGLLIPQLTSSQISSMETLLQVSEKGLMVFDSDLKQFFYWDGTSWISFTQSLNFAGTTLNILNGNSVDLTSLIDDADADPLNEIQTLTKTGNTITISNSGTPVNIGEGTPSLGQTLEWNGSDWIPVTPAGAQSLSLTGTTLSIQNANSVDLSPLGDDADADPLNELQTIIKSGNTITLSNSGGTFNLGEGTPTPGQTLEWDGGNWVPVTPAGAQTLNFSGTTLDILNGNSVDLSSLIDDADPDPNNEIQVLTKAGNTVTLSNGGGSFTDDVVDADADPANENQTVSAGAGISVNQVGQDFAVTNTLPDQVVNLADGGSGHVVISGTYPNLTIDVPSLDDADASATNEIQTITAGAGITVTPTGNDYQIDNAAPDVPVNLSAASLNISISGSYPNYILDVPSLNDADADPTNENQTVSAGAGISVAQTGQDFVVTNALPDQVVSLADGGSGHVLIGGTYPNLTIDVPSLDDADASATNEIQTITAGTGITVIPTGNDYQIDNAAPDVPVNLSAASLNVSISGSYPNFILDVPSLNDADSDPANENQTVSAGVGISVNQVGQDFTVTNTLPDQVVNLADGGSGHVVISGTYPNLTLDVPSLDDADASATNEIQTITAGAGITVTPTGNDYQIDNAAPDVPVNLSAASLNISISGAYPNYILDVPSLDDADASSTNEIQTVDQLDLTGSTLNLSLLNDGAAPSTVDLSTINTDNQDLTLTGNTLSLTNDGTTVDLSAYLDNTDNQDLTLGGNILSLTNDGTTVDLSGYLDNTDNQTVDQFDLTGSTLNLSLLNDGTAPYTVDLSTFSIASVAGEAGNYLTTDGSNTSWVPLGALAQLNAVTTSEIINGSITEADLANSIAGNGIAGGAGIPLSVDLAANSGMNFLSNQLQMVEIYPGGITYDGGAATAIRSITFDSKGRFISASSIAVLLSDIRLKKEITHLNSSLEKVTQLNGYNYYLKSDTLNKELKTGVIAQEVEKVFPNLVLTRPDGFFAVEYQGLIPILLEAIKEQQVMIEDLKTEVNGQKQINEEQESRIMAMEGKLDQILQLISP